MSLENPQLEDGYLKIVVSIAEALARTQLSGYESRVLWFLWRKTYGWGKKRDVIPLDQFVDGTGIGKRHVINTISRLVKRGIISKDGTEIRTRKPATYEFNKHFGEWKDVPKSVPVPNLVPKSVPKLVPKSAPSIERVLPKEKVLKRFVVANKIDDDPVVQLYRKICVPAGLPNILVLTSFRVRAIKRITKEYGLEHLEVLFKKAITSKFLLGDAPSKSHSGWRADFDFFLRAETLVYINEGSRYFDAPLESGPLLSVPIWTPEQDAKYKEEARKWIEDESKIEEAR
jgi:phage replication O-like protein O